MVNPFERMPGRKEGTAEMMTCPNCAGKGYLDKMGKETCYRCSGRERIPNRS